MINIKILAIDQATKDCGFCVIENPSMNIERFGKISLEKGETEERIAMFKEWVKQIILAEKIDHVFMEDVQFQRNQKTYKVLSELLGVMKNNCLELNVPYQVVPPVTWKSYCNIKGKKRSEQKANAINKAKELTGEDVSEDTADAICIAFYGANNVIADG